MAYIIELRRDIAAAWATKNPVLAAGEMGIETDYGRRKIGDGVTPWNQLSYERADVVVSAGTASQQVSQLIFSNSNGVSFGISNGTVTASAAGGGGGIAGIKLSAGTLSATRSDVTFSNANGVTFGLDTNGNISASVFTNYQSAGAYLTTAMASDAGSRFAGTNGAATGASITVNTSGVSVALPAYLTTAMASNASTGFAGINGSIAGGSITVNTSGVTVSLPAYLTTAMQSNAATISNVKVSAGTLSALRSDITFSNANGVSFGLDTNGAVTATVQTNYLTTADLSQNSSKYAATGFTTTTVAGAVVAGTHDTNGLKLAVPTFITTAAQSSQTLAFSLGGNSATTNSSQIANGGFILAGGNNITIQQSNNTISISAANVAAQPVQISAGTTSNNLGTVVFANANGFSFGLGTGASSQSITASYTVPTITSATISDANTSISLARLAFTNSNGLTLSLSTTTGGSATLVGSYTVPSVTHTSLTMSDVNTSLTIARLAFTNSNGLTLSLSTTTGGSATLIGSYTVPNVPAATSLTISDNATSITAARLAFTNLNGITLSLSTTTGGSATVVGSYTVPSTAGHISAINVSAGTTSTNASAFTFSNANGVSFGIGTGASAGVVTATVQTNYLTTAALSSQTLAFSLGGNSATTNSSQISNGGYVLAGGNNVTLQQSNNTVSISVGNYLTTAALSTQTLAFSLGGNSATTNSSQISNGGYVLAGGNNVTIRQSNNTISISAFNQSSQSAIEGVGVSNAGNTAGNVGLLTGSDYVLAGSGSITLSQSTAAGAATCWIQHPAWITTAALSSQTLAFSLGGNSGTTNSSQILNGGYVLAGGANVTIQQSNNTISISAAAAAAAPVNISAGTTSNNLGSIVFANANGVSFGLNTGASSQSITASIATSLTNINFSAGTTSSNISAMTFSNANGVSFGLGTGASAGVVTASVAAGAGAALSNSQTYYSTGTIGISEAGGAITIATSAGGQSFMFSVPQTSSLTGANGLSISTNGSTISVVAPMNSYWANQDRMIDDNSTVVTTAVSAIQVLPFIMPYAISGGFLRAPVSISMVSSESAATTANSTVTFNRIYSQAIVLYDNNTGASSLSLSSVFSTLAAWTIQYVVGMGAQGSRYTVTQNITYPISGTTSQFTTSSAQSSANVGFSTNLLTAFTGPRFLDIPFATSLAPGNYWIAFGGSTGSATTGGIPVGLSGASMGMSYVGMTHSNLAWGVPGAATNSSIHLMPGLGSWSTNSAVMTTASLQLASISSASSNPLIYFQIQRFA